MPQQVADPGRYTVGVFQGVEWAEKGLEALSRHGFPAQSLTIIGKDSPEVAALIERTLGRPGSRITLRTVGAVLATGPLVEALQRGSGDLEQLGLAATFRRVGFQAHDGSIYETLTARGGILVAVRSEPRAADALATLHNYGGGNAAIGAWLGRV
jgi:hypothetical protein